MTKEPEETSEVVEVATQAEGGELLASPESVEANPRIPQYRRDISPNKLSLSADDLRELCELLTEANDRAKVIEVASANMDLFDSKEQAEDRINELMQIEYNYQATNGDSVMGLGLPDVQDRSFPTDLRSFFVSNSSFPDRSVQNKPSNSVDAFF